MLEESNVRALGCDNLIQPSHSRNDHASGLEFFKFCLLQPPTLLSTVGMVFPQGSECSVSWHLGSLPWTVQEWILPSFPSEAFLFLGIDILSLNMLMYSSRVFLSLLSL